jgi:GTP-binding protein HflX
MEQTRPADPTYQIGIGKVDELAKLVKDANADRVIFDNRLSPTQAYNLAKATGVENIDRFQLILEIFSRRATTAEAQLQIRLARLRHDLARAKDMVRLSKKGEQPGFMGLGAFEADVYYESVKREVHTIRRKLRKTSGKRVLHRQRRTELEFQSISLAGYTKAGKSSLFNALTEAEVPVDSALFTTLSTTTRLVEISKRKFLLTDTVGFIDRLPLTLIEAFHSTLEETIYSDLILLLVDISEPLNIVEKKLSVCIETLERIGASGIPIITVFNKIDLRSEQEISQKISALEDKALTLVPVSARCKTNIDTLKQEVLKMFSNYVRASFKIPLSDETMSFLSWIFKNANVQTVKYAENSAEVVFESSPTLAEKIRNRVERFNGKIETITR